MGTPLVDPTALALAQGVQSHEEAKQRAEDEFKRGCFSAALAYYERALALAQESARGPAEATPGAGAPAEAAPGRDHDEPMTPTEEQRAQLTLQVVLTNNIAMCLLKLEAWKEARDACSKGLAVAGDDAGAGDANVAKTYFRRGQARKQLGELGAAAEDIEDALQHALRAGMPEATLRQMRVELAEVKRPARGASSLKDPAGLLAFFAAGGADCEGRRLAEMRAWDDSRLEYTHDYIQWFFPTDEASMFNPDAPLLTPQLARAFAEDPAVMEQLRLNLQRFCRFLGLEARRAGDQMEVVRAPNLHERVPDCWGGFNHNWLRISRALQCLGLVGLRAEQEAFMGALEELYQVLPALRASMPHWRERARTVPAWR